jgi:phosphoribosylanthranilate isomerase
MTRIKICGITRVEDALQAAECGADGIGLNFADSPRRVSPERAGEIMAGVGPFLTGVGVFVDSSVEEVRSALETSWCTVAQLHGSEPADFIPALSPYRVVKAIRVRGALDESLLRRYKDAAAILLDTYVPGQAGGTGRRFDPAVAARLVKEGWRVIVAGGLTADNVGEVVAAVRPYGVDVSTGVEAAPGKKDPRKVAEFIAAVRAADRRAG